jgi:hypothetical protein
MTEGIGLALSRSFYERSVRPIIAAHAPGLRYAAARIGDGSEVLGYDTPMSADHNCGPGVQLFLPESQFATVAPALMAALDSELPATFEGHPVSYLAQGRPTADDMPIGMFGSFHGVELFTLSAWYRRQFAAELSFPSATIEWLAIPEQLLLTVTAGAVFRDDGGELTIIRDRLSYFPRDVWLLKIAAQWARIGEEQAFVGRTGDNGDDIGSRIISARLVRDVMRLCFLIERRYVPYPKWFGTAFLRLDCAGRIVSHLSGAITASDWQHREAALAHAYRAAAELLSEREVPGAVAPVIGPYFTRPFTVINAEAISDGLRAAIDDPILREFPFGAIDQWVDATPVLSRPERARGAQRGLGS